MAKTIDTVVRRREASRAVSVDADICVLGAGISGVSAAVEAARLGRKVVIADGAPALGGQAVGSIIGTIIGLFSHGRDAYQLTHGLADELIAELTASGDLLERHSAGTGTITFQYDVMQLARWMERKIEAAGVRTLIGATLTGVDFADRRIRRLHFATRFGAVVVNAASFVDASGDAVLSWEAGLSVREPDAPVYGSLNFLRALAAVSRWACVLHTVELNGPGRGRQHRGRGSLRGCRCVCPIRDQSHGSVHGDGRRGRACARPRRRESRECC